MAKKKTKKKAAAKEAPAKRTAAAARASKKKFSASKGRPAGARKTTKRAAPRAPRAAGPGPGRGAIDAALALVHGDQAPVLRRAFDEALEQVAAYEVALPRPHWHLVGYGLSELDEKRSGDETVSGHGFELTLRVARAPGERGPPAWAVDALQELARYVATTGNRFDVGHHMDLNGPIAEGSGTHVHAVAFAPDPDLPPRDTPFGRLQFLQVVGLWKDELRAAERWDARRFLEVLERAHPRHILDLTRGSILDDPAVRAEVEAGIERDGSSQGGVFVDALAWEERGGATVLSVDAFGAMQIADMLRGRTRHGRPFLVDGPEHRLVVEPGEASVEVDGPTLGLRLPMAEAARLADELHPRPGSYRWPGLGVTVEVHAVAAE